MRVVRMRWLNHMFHVLWRWNFQAYHHYFTLLHFVIPSSIFCCFRSIGLISHYINVVCKNWKAFLNSDICGFPPPTCYKQTSNAPACQRRSIRCRTRTHIFASYWSYMTANTGNDVTKSIARPWFAIDCCWYFLSIAYVFEFFAKNRFHQYIGTSWRRKYFH